MRGVRDHPRQVSDGNARETSSSWMEPQADTADGQYNKNIIDKEHELPQTAEMESPLVPAVPARPSSGTPNPDSATGCSTTSLKQGGWRPGAAKHQLAPAGGGHRPARDLQSTSMLLGEVRQLLGRRAAHVPMDSDRYHMTADEAVRSCATRNGVVAVLGSDLRRLVQAGAGDLRRAGRTRRARGDVPVHVDGASGAFVALPRPGVGNSRCRSPQYNASGHKLWLVYPGVG